MIRKLPSNLGHSESAIQEPLVPNRRRSKRNCFGLPERRWPGMTSVVRDTTQSRYAVCVLWPLTTIGVGCGFSVMASIQIPAYQE